MQDKNGLELGTAQRGKPGKSILVKNTTAADIATIRDTFGYKVDPIDGSTLIFTDLDSAYNVARASLGDTIFVSEGYTQTADSAGEVTCDVAGVSFVGLGTGASRPTITFDGSGATPSIIVSAASNLWKNFLFVNNEASLNHMFDVKGDDLTIEDCEFREGTATGLSFITADTADNDSDRLTIRRCSFYATTAGNYDNAIALAKDFTNVLIEDCDFDGDFDDAAIHVPAGGNAQVNLRILRCTVKNRLTNVAAISINGTDSSGIIKDCLLRTDTKATALDNGSLATSNVRWTDETDQVGDSAIFVEPDSVSNILGADDADNGFSSSNVTANVDGSVLERLEAIQQHVGATDGSTNILGADDADNGFASTNVADNRDGSIIERLESIIATQRDDVASNFIGVDDADNVASTTNVVGNKDGSILERLEDITQELSGTSGIGSFPSSAAPANGVSLAEVIREEYDQADKAVTNTTATLVNGTTLFTITGGPIEILSLVARCVTGNDATASTLQWSADPTDGASATFSAASASLANALAGAMVVLQGTTLATAPIVNTTGVGLGQQVTNGIVVGAGIITSVVGVGSTTGTWQHHMRYRPLSRGVTVS